VVPSTAWEGKLPERNRLSELLVSGGAQVKVFAVVITRVQSTWVAGITNRGVEVDDSLSLDSPVIIEPL
jgi:hypothetical protein